MPPFSDGPAGVLCAGEGNETGGERVSAGWVSPGKGARRKVLHPLSAQGVFVFVAQVKKNSEEKGHLNSVERTSDFQIAVFRFVPTAHSGSAVTGVVGP